MSFQLGDIVYCSRIFTWVLRCKKVTFTKSSPLCKSSDKFSARCNFNYWVIGLSWLTDHLRISFSHFINVILLLFTHCIKYVRIRVFTNPGLQILSLYREYTSVKTRILAYLTQCTLKTLTFEWCVTQKCLTLSKSLLFLISIERVNIIVELWVFFWKIIGLLSLLYNSFMMRNT